MRESSLSQEYASQRAKELFEELMGNEKEVVISRLQEDLIQKRNEISRLEKITREFEEKFRREESEKERAIRATHDLKAQLGESEMILEDKLKRKDHEWLQKLEDITRGQNRKIDDTRTELEEQVKKSLKEIENLNFQKQRDLAKIRELESELNKLSLEVGNVEKREQQWKTSARSIEDNRATIQNRLEYIIEENRELQNKLDALEDEKKTSSRTSELISRNMKKFLTPAIKLYKK